MRDGGGAHAIGNIHQKNVKKGVNNGLMELEESLDSISFYRRKLTTTGDARKAKTTALPAENAVIAKQTADSPLQNELGKK